jgi:hypothetical protein
MMRDGSVWGGRAEIRAALDDIAGSRRNIRYIHLSAHLETPGILSPAQIRKYNELRGYTAADPCDAGFWPSPRSRTAAILNAFV